MALALQEESSTAWDDPLVGDYGAPGSSTATTYNPSTPTRPDTLTADAVYGGIVVSWGAPGDNSASSYEVAEYTANTPVTSATIVWTGNATNCYRPFSSSSTRYYWVRSVRGARKSGWRGSGETSTGVGATSLLPTSEALTGTLDKSTASGNGSTPVTTDTVTCTASGGSGTGYTYTWTYVSGDDSPQSITPNSPSSAATTFNGTANSKEAVWKCVVDDSLSGGPVDSDHVTVTIGPGSLSASASPSLLNKMFSGGGSQTTGTTTCTASGGTATYTYAWSRVSGDTTITATASTSATTAFNMSSAEEASAIWKCTVTDSASPQVTADSNNVTVRFINMDT